jgi:PAS domain S-box-containing protein
MTDREDHRLAGLRRHRILDTAAEEQFDDAVQLVRTICEVPIALVTLVDEDRQWFKAASGIDLRETPRDTSVCALAIEGRGLFVVPDLTRDVRTAAMALVTGAPHLRFYAGAPLVTSDGIALGSLCAIDVVPRPEGLTEEQRSGLAALGRHVTTLIEMRIVAAREQAALDAGRDAEAHYRHVIDSALDCAIIGIDPAGDVTAWSKGAESIFGWTEAEMLRRPLATIFTPEDRACGRPAKEMAIARETGRAPDERWHLRKDGTRFYAHGAVTPLVGSGERGFVKSLRDITGEHRTRIALDRNREELELAMRAARLGRFDFKPHSGKLAWDDRTRELFGLCPTAPVTYDGAFLTALHPEDRALTDGAIAAALDPAGSRSFEIEYRTIGLEDGIERYVAAHGITVFDGIRPIRLIGTVQDVTASRSTLKRLAQTEERLRLAARATNDAIWDWDLATDAVQWNDALFGAYGYARDEVEPTGAWWIGHIHPDDRDRISRSIHAVIDGTASDWTDSYRFRRSDGRYADIKDRGYVIRDEQGHGVRMIGAMLDESVQAALRRSLEDIVTEQAERFDLLWETSPDLLLVIDFAGYLRRVNPAWTTILGYDPAELIGHHVNEFVVSDDAEKTVVAYETAAGDGQSAVENRYRHKDGSTRWFSWVAAAANGVTYASGRHVTAAKEGEAALRAAEDQLRQAQKVEAIGQLTGGVAHDFNNLLTVIRGSVDLLRSPSLTEEKRVRYIDAIADTADRATRLTSQLLAFARRQALKPQIFDAGASVVALKDMVRTLTGSRVETLYTIPATEAFIEADRNQFDTALVNMAVNARDAMNGEGRLSIAVRRVDRVPPIRGHGALLGDHVAVAITDSGSGIAADKIDHIFEPFFTTKDVGQGTGLGLSQVFGFAKQSGGDIMVESVEGQGTTFTLFLPCVPAPIGGGAAVADGVHAASSTGACILIVEDNEAVGRFATQALTELGYRSAWVASADAALAELAAGSASYDAVFTDVVMPGRSGIELAEEVRGSYPALSVILTSGYSHVLAERGTRGFPLLHKPYSVEELAVILRSVIRERR